MMLIMILADNNTSMSSCARTQLHGPGDEARGVVELIRSYVQ